jgi:hypothetical protein
MSTPPPRARVTLRRCHRRRRRRVAGADLRGRAAGAASLDRGGRKRGHLPHARRAPPRGHHHTDACAWRRGHSAVYARPPSFVSLPPSACRRSRPRAHLRRLRRRRWAVRLGVHRLFMVFVAISADPARGSRQTPSSCVIAADVIPCSFEATTPPK